MRTFRSALFRVAEALDRSVGRPVLGAVASVVISVRTRQLCRVQRRADAWTYRWAEGVIPDDRLRIRRGAAANPTLWATRGSYTFDDLWFWAYRPKAGDVVVDVGAGFGTEVLMLANLVGPTGKVFAFEAHPPTFSRLKKLCELNSWPQVVPVLAAVADVRGILAVSDGERYETNNIFDAGVYEVPAITLDDFVDEQGIDRIDWLKMNIEGAEKLAICGMERTAPLLRHACISCHDFLGTEWGRSKDEVSSWLERHGFTVRSQVDHPEPWGRDYLYASH